MRANNARQVRPSSPLGKVGGLSGQVPRAATRRPVATPGTSSHDHPTTLDTTDSDPLTTPSPRSDTVNTVCDQRASAKGRTGLVHTPGDSGGSGPSTADRAATTTSEGDHTTDIRTRRALVIELETQRLASLTTALGWALPRGRGCAPCPRGSTPSIRPAFDSTLGEEGCDRQREDRDAAP